MGFLNRIRRFPTCTKILLFLLPTLCVCLFMNDTNSTSRFPPLDGASMLQFVNKIYLKIIPETKAFFQNNKLEVLSDNKSNNTTGNQINSLKWRAGKRERNVLPPGVTIAEFKKFVRESSDSQGQWPMDKYVRSACDKYNTTMNIRAMEYYRTLYNHLLYHEEYQLVYCPVWKAMSTTWDEYFVKIKPNEITNTDTTASSDNKDKKSRHKDNIKISARQYSHLPKMLSKARMAIKSSCSFLVVRHPFTRLVSIYRDKMVKRTSRVHNYLYLKTLIKHRYRTNSSDTSKNPTFEEFVQYVVDQWSASDPRPGTWHEPSYDWYPSYYLCAPCHINYTMIIRYENIEEELPKLENECGVRTSLVEGTHHHQIGNTTSSELEDELFRQLPLNLILRLSQIYYFDLVMFGYDISHYLHLRR